MKYLEIFLFCLQLAVSEQAPEQKKLNEIPPPRVTFKWTSPLSMLMTNSRGKQVELELRPAPGIGEVEVACLFDAFLPVGTEGSAAVHGCQNSTEVSLVIVSNFTQGTMFTFFPHNQTTVEHLDSEEEDSDSGNEEEGIERIKRSDFTDPEDDYVDDFSFSFSGALTLPENLYFKLGVGYDQAFLEKMSGDKRQAEEYINTIVTLARPFYKQTSLGTNLHFMYNEEIRYLEGQQYKIDPAGSGSSVHDAKSIKTEELLIIITHTDDTEIWKGVAINKTHLFQKFGKELL